MESHPLFTYVEHLERKKERNRHFFRRPQV